MLGLRDAAGAGKQLFQVFHSKQFSLNRCPWAGNTCLSFHRSASLKVGLTNEITSSLFPDSNLYWTRTGTLEAPVPRRLHSFLKMAFMSVLGALSRSLSPGRNPSLFRNVTGDFTPGGWRDKDIQLSLLASMPAFLIMQTASSLLSLFHCEP